jgi:hypothetical protein
MESTVTTANSEENLGAAMSQWEVWQINDVVFIVSDALTFSGFLWFFDLNLLKHGHWLMKCLHTFHLCMEYLLQCIMWLNDF